MPDRSAALFSACRRQGRFLIPDFPMTAIDPEALGARAEALIADLAKISAEPERPVRLQGNKKPQ
jgi:hypothetical protein